MDYSQKESEVGSSVAKVRAFYRTMLQVDELGRWQEANFYVTGKPLLIYVLSFRGESVQRSLVRCLEITRII